MFGSASLGRVATRGHPSFSQRQSLATLGLSLLVAAQVFASAGGEFRLAGLVAVGQDYLGFIELPDGQQVLVRQGSTLEDGGRVVRLSAAGVSLRWPDRRLDLELQQSGRPRKLPPGLGVVQSRSEQGHVLVRTVDSQRMSESLAETPGAVAGDLPGTLVAQRLSPIIGLPPHSRVVAVNEVPIRSVDQAVRLVQQSLADNVPVRLNLQGAPGSVETRVYVLPAPVRP